jgi:hypothetical protein
MRSSFTTFTGTLVLASLASAAPGAPAAPQVTVGADLKQLQFDWDRVPSATRYELWFKANDAAAWVKYIDVPGARSESVRINVSVHLLDWRVARYRLAACDASGCTNSAETHVTQLGNDAIGYFKPNTPAYNHWYGSAVALSADGRTFAVQTGENLGTAADSVTVQIYRKPSRTSGWRHEAALEPNVTQEYTTQPYWGGNPLALSGDGNLLAFGVPTEAAVSPDSWGSRGAVYLFRRTGSSWQLEHKLVGEPISGNYFGSQVELDDAGTTLAVTHNRSPSEATFVRGVTDIYRRASTGWQLVRTLQVPQNDMNQCFSISLSGDGRTLFRTCSDPDYVNGVVQVFRAPGWDADPELTVAGANWIDSTFDGARFAVRTEQNLVRIFNWLAGVWTQDGEFKTGKENYHGPNLAISRDGAIVVGADYFDSTAGTGIVYPATQQNGTIRSGTVWVYERRSFGWNLRRILKPAVARDQAYGTVLALGDRGRVLAVGAFGDASAASGIGGDPTDTTVPERGAAWLY